jgi:hypothetical protein
MSDIEQGNENHTRSLARSTFGTYQISMNDRGGVNVVQASQHLIEKRLNVFRRQVLRRHY